MALLAYHEDPRRFLLTEDSPTVLDRSSNEYVKRQLQQTTIALHKIATNCSPIYISRLQHVHLSLAHVISHTRRIAQLLSQLVIHLWLQSELAIIRCSALGCCTVFWQTAPRVSHSSASLYMYQNYVKKCNQYLLNLAFLGTQQTDSLGVAIANSE